MRVCKIFECVRRGKERGSVPKRSRTIDHDSLALGNLSEIRHVFARIVFDTVYPQNRNKRLNNIKPTERWTTNYAHIWIFLCAIWQHEEMADIKFTGKHMICRYGGLNGELCCISIFHWLSVEGHIRGMKFSSRCKGWIRLTLRSCLVWNTAEVCGFAQKGEVDWIGVCSESSSNLSFCKFITKLLCRDWMA